MSDEQEPRPRHVWWSPSEGVVVRHPDEPEQYVAVSGRDGVYLDGWPQDAKLLHAEYPDWRGRAEMWERMSHGWAKDADARVARAEADAADARAEAARLKAQLYTLQAESARPS